MNDKNKEKPVDRDENEAEGSDALADRVDGALQALRNGDPAPLDRIVAEESPLIAGDDVDAESIDRRPEGE